VITNRRKFLITLSGLIAAPAVVKADSIMRVVSIKNVETQWWQDVARQCIVNKENPMLTISHLNLANYVMREKNGDVWGVGSAAFDGVDSPRWLEFILHGQGFIDMAKREQHEAAFRPHQFTDAVAFELKPIRKETLWKPLDIKAPEDMPTT